MLVIMCMLATHTYHKTGAPFSPFSQGLVERVFGTFKHRLLLACRQLSLRDDLWPWVPPGIQFGVPLSRRLFTSFCSFMASWPVGFIVNPTLPALGAQIKAYCPCDAVSSVALFTLELVTSWNLAVTEQSPLLGYLDMR
eukprot:GHVR01091982.1.p3 GENE.GHVR01091982.1~~GHVR01091982.1.p3  ORF type:complete len:139 (+),score=7.74 GHVR01091982.1:269-685(+)